MLSAFFRNLAPSFFFRLAELALSLSCSAFLQQVANKKMRIERRTVALGLYRRWEGPELLKLLEPYLPD